MKNGTTISLTLLWDENPVLSQLSLTFNMSQYLDSLHGIKSFFCCLSQNRRYHRFLWNFQPELHLKELNSDLCNNDWFHKKMFCIICKQSNYCLFSKPWNIQCGFSPLILSLLPKQFELYLNYNYGCVFQLEKLKFFLVLVK